MSQTIVVEAEVLLVADGEDVALLAEGAQGDPGPDGADGADGAGTGTLVVTGQAALDATLRRIDVLVDGEAAIASPLSMSTGAVEIAAPLDLTGELILNGDHGAAGQYVVSDGPGNPPTWEDLPSLSGHLKLAAPLDATLRDVTDHAGTTAPIKLSSTGVEVGALNLTNNLTIASAPGTAGQYLASGGAGNPPTWETIPTPTLTGYLKLTAALDATLRVVEDYAGTDSPLWVSTTGVSAIAPASGNVPLTVKGAGSQTANLLNLVSSADVVLASVSAAGHVAARSAVLTYTAPGTFDTLLGVGAAGADQTLWVIAGQVNIRCNPRSGGAWLSVGHAGTQYFGFEYPAAGPRLSISGASSIVAFASDNGPKWNAATDLSGAYDIGLVRYNDGATTWLKPTNGSTGFGPLYVGLVNFAGTMGDSTKTVGTDAPADWVEIRIGANTYYLPAYAA